MVKRELCDKFLKLKTEENRPVHVKQHNFCVILLRGKKMESFPNENLNRKIDKKSFFWKTVFST